MTSAASPQWPCVVCLRPATIATRLLTGWLRLPVCTGCGELAKALNLPSIHATHRVPRP